MLKRNKGNRPTLIEDKVDNETTYKARDSEGNLKPWVICQLLRQEFGLTIKEINEEHKKHTPPESLYKLGLEKISEGFLLEFISICKMIAANKFTGRYKIHLFNRKLFSQKFTSIEQIRGYLLQSKLLHIHNLTALEETIENRQAYNKLQSFRDNRSHSIALLSGAAYSGKTSTMTKLFKELKADDDYNVIYLDIAAITNVAFFQMVLINKLKESFNQLDYQKELVVEDLSLVELLNLRKKWFLIIDTGNRTVYGAEFERFVTQNDYVSFVMRLISCVNAEMKVVISEQFTHRNLPEHFEYQVTDIEVLPVIGPTEAYIASKYSKGKLSKEKLKFFGKASRFNCWSEEQCYIYAHLLKLFVLSNALDSDYKELNDKFEKQLDISKLLVKYVLDFRPPIYQDLQLVILESLIQIEEGFQYITLEKLCEIHLRIPILDVDSEFSLESFLDAYPEISDWLNLFTTQSISQSGIVMLQPALRNILLNGGIKPTEETQVAIIQLTEAMMSATNPKALNDLICNSDLSIPENYLALHRTVVPGLHAFKVSLSRYLTYGNEDTRERENVIHRLYELYDKTIELNGSPVNRKRRGFALGKIFLSYDVKLQLVSDIIALNKGPDNGRMITKESSLMKALGIDKVFYLLESLSVSSIACLRYGSIAKASYLLGFLYHHLKTLPQSLQNEHTLSISKRCQARIFQNDIVLKTYFNPTSAASPTIAFADILLPNIMALTSEKLVTPSTSFYYRRLTKLWVDHARTLLSESSAESFILVCALSSQLNQDSNLLGLQFKSETCERYTAALGHLISIDKPLIVREEEANTSRRHTVMENCANTYSITSIIYITQRNLLKLFLDRTALDINTQVAGNRINAKLCFDVLQMIFENLLTKTNEKYLHGVNDFSTLISLKTALLRGQATCRFLIQNKAESKSIFGLIDNFIEPFDQILKKIDSMLMKLRYFDEQALFLKTDSSHLISGSHYVVRNSIQNVVLGKESFDKTYYQETKNEIKKKIYQLKGTREVRLTLELEFFLVLMDLLHYFSTKPHKPESSTINHSERIRDFRILFSKFNERFRRQGRGEEVQPIFDEVFSYMNAKVNTREQYLIFIILMFF